MGARDLNQALPEGFRLREYRIERLLASGGFSLVYLAQDAGGALVAIKEYFPWALASRAHAQSQITVPATSSSLFHQGLSCFFEEGRALARLRHPNVLRVLDFFRDNGTAYIAMRYEHGATLQERIESCDAAPHESWIRSTFAPLLLGLREVHAHRLLHLDIKPGNVYLRTDGSPLLIDFGATRRALGGESAHLPPVYTPGFASPEHHADRARLGPWSDIYSIGACLYACLSAETPPPAPERLREDRLIPAAKRWASRYSAPFLRAVDWCLRLDPLTRPQSVFALQKAAGL